MTAPPAIEIQWQAPAQCPDATAVRARVEQLLGKSLAAVPAPKVEASGRVVLNEAGKWQLHVRLTVGTHEEEDTLIANKCAALGDAMALKVALAVDPLAVVDAVQQSQERVATPAATVEQPVVYDATATAQRVGIGVRLVGAVSVGPLPGTTPGIGLYASLQWRRFRVELGGQAFWAGVARYDSPPAVGADLQLFAGAVRGCVTPGVGDWLFPICVGPELGTMRARGFGAETTFAASGLWGGLVLGPAVQWRMAGRFSLWLEPDLVLTVLRPEFHVRNLPQLYSPSGATARASLGFEAKF